jgi:hypothetical protein
MTGRSFRGLASTFEVIKVFARGSLRQKHTIRRRELEYAYLVDELVISRTDFPALFYHDEESAC